MTQDDLQALKDAKPTWMTDGHGIQGPPQPEPEPAPPPELPDAFRGRSVRQGQS